MTGLAGTGMLVRMALRLDRVRLSIWVAAITLIVVSTAASFSSLYPDEASRAELAGTLGTNPALLAMYGVLYAPTIGGLTVWRQGSIVLVFVGLMNLFTVIRHTRAEEEDGRLELVRATAVGPRANLVAAVATAAIADAAIAVLVTIGLVAVGQPMAGSLAFGLGLGCAGLAIGGLAGLLGQLTVSARAARGLAGAALAAAFALRAVGDASRGTGLEALSWISPLGWAQRVRPYADERWWVLLLPLALALVGGIAADRVAARRDLGAGLLEIRPGPDRADPALLGSGGLAWRLQRGVLLWWAIGVTLLGGMFGAAVDAIADLFETTPQLGEILERLGGTSRIVDAFLGSIMGVLAVLAAAYAVGATLRLHGEETTGRAELQLATAVPRRSWAASHVAIAAVGPAVLLACAGGAVGLTSGLILGRGLADVGRGAGAALVHLPAVWVVVGIAVLVLGIAPRWAPAAWGALATFFLLGQVGPVLQLDQWLLDLSPFVHVPALPGAALTWAPLAWLTAAAVALGGTGLLGLQRRDLGTV